MYVCWRISRTSVYMYGRDFRVGNKSKLDDVVLTDMTNAHIFMKLSHVYYVENKDHKNVEK